MEQEHLKEIKRINRWSGEVQGPQVLGRIAQLNYSSNRMEDAFENYLDVLSFDPQNEMALAHVAFMMIGQQEYDLAEPYFKRLTAAAGQTAEYHFARGIGLAMARKGEEALESMKLGLSLSPNKQSNQILAALQFFREGEAEGSQQILDDLIPKVTDPYIGYIANRLAVVVNYLNQKYDDALKYGERVLQQALKEEWDQEEYDARLSLAYMSMLAGDLEKANEHLLELEIRNPADEKVMQISDFRMDLEEQVAQVDAVSPRGFDFVSHLQDWARNRFPDDAVYRLSGLKDEIEFDVLSFFTTEGDVVKKERPEGGGIDPAELIGRFNALKGEAFQGACQRIISALGFKLQNVLDYRDKDGADFIATSQEDKKVKALFRIRQWSNQPISDIFIREQQNYMNELKVQQGFVVAGARLTGGAEQALENLKKINVVNEETLGGILQRIL